jgi:hypothetical protein
MTIVTNGRLKQVQNFEMAAWMRDGRENGHDPNLRHVPCGSAEMGGTVENRRFLVAGFITQKSLSGSYSVDFKLRTP